jgi:hypothetical protein
VLIWTRLRRLVRIASAFAKVDDKISLSESKENIFKKLRHG